jgi:hypothetical protein
MSVVAGEQGPAGSAEGGGLQVGQDFLLAPLGFHGLEQDRGKGRVGPQVLEIQFMKE